jgi:hypothetical protein
MYANSQVSVAKYNSKNFVIHENILLEKGTKNEKRILTNYHNSENELEPLRNNC